MSDQQVLRYLDLVDRRLKAILGSGVDWEPELAAELERIDKELAGLRPVVDAARRVAARRDECVFSP